MVAISRLAEIGALVGEPSRAAMLAALLGGRALTAGELARAAGVTQQTASGHLARLADARLIVARRQGRRRYHRLASLEVAGVLEAMMRIAGEDGARPRRASGDAALRAARTCYDHLAGKLGVAVADALARQKLVELDFDAARLTPAGEKALADFGIDIAACAAGRRTFCRPCLDWSERRPHLAGAVGAAIMERTLALGWVRRREATRAVTVTPPGMAGLRKTLGVADIWS